MAGLLLMRVAEKNGRRGLVPVSADARAALAKLAVHERVWVKTDRSRSGPQHRLFWQLLTTVAESTAYETADRLLVALKLRTGLVDLCMVPGKAEPVLVPKSISFNAMKQDEFNAWMKLCVEIICSEVLGGYDEVQLLGEVQLLLEPPKAA